MLKRAPLVLFDLNAGSFWQFTYCNSGTVLGDLYTEAAELATAAMKGRIASKYYVLADEAWSQVSDE
jgi:hypothetical protein